MSRRALFVDRDGVLIENREHYVRRLAEIELIPAAIAAGMEANRAGWPIVVVSNQAGVGKGVIPIARAWAIMSRVCKLFAREGVIIERAFLCPHRPDEGCDCRKPGPGMLIQAAEELDLDLEGSYLVGDNLSDMGAARAAGAFPILVRTGLGTRFEAEFDGTIANDLLEAWRFIQAREPLA